MELNQITALAREYAEFTDLSPVDKKNVSAICEHFLKYTLRRYCLVEKSKLTEEYKSATANFNNASDPVIPTMDYYLGIMKFIEFLFPEIAKEVEE